MDDSGKIPRVLLERQYRHAAGAYLWELPAGRIDPGENELKAAQRELIEETGYRATHWRRILKFYASPGFLAETMSVYLATGLQAGVAEPEEDEMIRKRMFPLPAAVNMILTGKIHDAKDHLFGPVARSRLGEKRQAGPAQAAERPSVS